jgi:hypothetical protein
MFFAHDLFNIFSHIRNCLFILAHQDSLIEQILFREYGIILGGLEIG